MQKHMTRLERLIDYDLKEAQRKAELARMEQETKRIEVMRRSLDKIRAAPKFLLQGRRSEAKSGQGGAENKIRHSIYISSPSPLLQLPLHLLQFHDFQYVDSFLLMNW